MSTTKKITFLLVVFVLCALGTTLVSAQNDTPNRQRPAEALIGARVLINSLAELTGATPREITKELEPGTTLAEIAVAHNIEPAAVITQAEATITTAINERVTNGRMSEERAAEALDDLNARLTTLIEEPRPERQPESPRRDNIQDKGERGLIGALVDLTGQQPRDLLEQAQTGGYNTLAELAAANNIEPADIVAAANTAATTRVEESVANGNLTEEQAEQILQGLDEFFTNAIDADLSRLLGPARRTDANTPIRQLVLQEVSTATGLEPADIIAQLQDGSTIAELLATHNADPDTIIANVIAETNNRLEEQLQEMLNNPLPTRPTTN